MSERLSAAGMRDLVTRVRAAGRARPAEAALLCRAVDQLLEDREGTLKLLRVMRCMFDDRASLAEFREAVDAVTGSRKGAARGDDPHGK